LSTHKKKSVALSSVFASILLTVMKLIVGLMTGSLGILSEAAHSALDFVAALITYLTVRVSDNPADTKHHFGHGKLESVSALIETLLLFITSGWIIYESVMRLLYRSVEVEATWYAFAIIAVSIVVDVSRSRALYKVARETKSQALEADALHFKSDIYSSAVIFLGLGFVAFGITYADSIAAIGVALFVLHAGYDLGKRTLDVLLDTAPAGIADEVKSIALNTDGIIEVGRVRVRPGGPAVFVDMFVSINRKVPLERVHKITQNLEKNIREKVSGADVVIHVKAVTPKKENILERIQTVAANHNLIANNIMIGTHAGRKNLSFDLEVKETVTLEEAHRQADHIEETLHREFGNDTDINIHIEPMGGKELLREKTDDKTLADIRSAIATFTERNPELEQVHKLTAETLGGRLFISLHAVTMGKTSLIKAHALSDSMEKHLRSRFKDAEKVVIHLEPVKCGQS
jgi:cation diffusion facilitator family transporter